MADKAIADSEATGSAQPPQDGPLDDTIGGSFNKESKRLLVEAFGQFGWDQSKGVRMVCTAFLESASVRDRVFRHVATRLR